MIELTKQLTGLHLKCPCCGMSQARLLMTPEPHHKCPACLHRWKKRELLKDYYKGLCDRSIKNGSTLQKKNAERLRFLKRYLNNGMTVLEIGCAEGFLGELLQRHFALTYSGVEPSQDADHAKIRLKKIWKSIDEIPSGVQFDFILSFHVLEHIPNIGRVIARQYELLKTDGIIVAEVPNCFGNARLPWDFNKEHIHIFGPTSLSCLFERHGFSVKETRTGCFESAIYNDSIRIVLKKKKGENAKRDLVDRFDSYLGKRFVVYGTGGDFDTLVSPYVKNRSVVAVIDGNGAKVGKKKLGKKIEGLQAIDKHKDEKYLIATYRYQEEIRSILRRKGVSPSHIVTLEDILDG